MFSIRLTKFLFLFLCLSVPALAQDGWEERKTRHFIIYFQNAPEAFIEEVDVAAEREYTLISEVLGLQGARTWGLNDRAKIYIYDDQEHYIDEGTDKNWSHGVASPQDKVIRSFPAAHGFFDSTLPHELAHIIFRELIGYEVQIPLWLEEGVAMYFEKGRRFGADAQVRQAIDEGTFIPLDELPTARGLSRISEAEIIFFYTEAASAVSFLIDELGMQKFKLFCRKLERDDSFNEAFRSIYTRQKDEEGLNEAWVDFLLEN